MLANNHIWRVRPIINDDVDEDNDSSESSSEQGESEDRIMDLEWYVSVEENEGDDEEDLEEEDQEVCENEVIEGSKDNGQAEEE